MNSCRSAIHATDVVIVGGEQMESKINIPFRAPISREPKDWREAYYRDGLSDVEPKLTDEEESLINLILWAVWRRREELILEPWLYGIEPFPPAVEITVSTKAGLNRYLVGLTEDRRMVWREWHDSFNTFSLLRWDFSQKGEAIDISLHPCLIVEMRRRFFLRDEDPEDLCSND